VRLWHIRKRVCVLANKSEPLIGMSRALAFSPRKGEFLAVGIGGRLANRRSGNFGKHAGKVVMMATKNLKTLSTFKVAKEMISDMCFSKDGGTLAVASNDNIIYLLTVNGPTDVQPKARCRGHSSYITHISMSYDAQWLMSNDGSGEILYWDVNTGDQETRLDKVKSATWSPNQCPLSWQTQGVWPANGDLTDVNACMTRGVGVSGMEGPPGYGMIVTADDFGKIKVFNSPSLGWCAPAMVHRGHSAHVTNVCFNADGSRVISVGGNDRCVFVWRVIQNVNANAKGGAGTFGSNLD
jgi:WD40 repeat protein